LIPGIATRSDTALYDAVIAAVDTAPECGRRAVVAMPDGRETASTAHTLDQAIARANERNTLVFVVGLRSDQFTPGMLKALAEHTGAQYFEAPTPADIDALYRKVDEQLAGQYVLRLRLNIPLTGGERRLRIETLVPRSSTVSERSFSY
jgi:Mg-chelatase subunit ChlD